MISPTRLFEMYIAMGLHFKEGSKYDFIKYDGKTRINEKSLLKRNDRYFFEKLANKTSNEDEAALVLMTNFVLGNTYIIKMDFNAYREFTGYFDAIAYRFEKDLHKYKETCPINECYSGSTDAYNYLILLNLASNGFIFKQYDKKFGKDDMLWSDLRDNKLNKIAPFIVKYYQIDNDMKARIRKIVKDNNV